MGGQGKALTCPRDCGTTGNLAQALADATLTFLYRALSQERNRALLFIPLLFLPFMKDRFYQSIEKTSIPLSQYNQSKAIATSLRWYGQSRLFPRTFLSVGSETFSGSFHMT